MRARNFLRPLLFICTLAALGAAVFLRSGRVRLSSLAVSPETAEELKSSRSQTDLRLLNGISFNGWRLFYDDLDGIFYYSLVENDSDAYDPYVQIDGNSRRVRIALTEGTVSAESIEAALPLRIIAYDGQTYREYQIRCTTLPLMNVESEIESIRGTQKDRDLKMTLFDNRAEARQRLIQMDGVIHVRGNDSTTVFPKQGYKMTLTQLSPGKHDREADLSLLGMDRQDGEWLLYAGYNDQERVRNVFSSALWNRSCAGENEFGIRNGMEYRFLELFMNGKYWGLYALGYPLDYKQMSPLRNTETVQAVYVYKKAFWKEAWSDLPEELQMRDFQIRGRDALADETRARALLAEYDQWVRDGAPGAASEPSGIRADMGNAADIWLYVALVQGMDTVEDSGDFVNMFQTLVDAGEDKVMLYTPWDLDLTWGNLRRPKVRNTTVPYGITVDDNSYIMLRNPANFLLPKNAGTLITRYQALRQDGWSEILLDQMIDEYEKAIYDSGAYLRDIEKWPDSSYQDPSLKLTDFRTYVHDRLQAMDEFVSTLGE